MSDNNVTTIDKDNSQSSHSLSITAKDNLATWQVGLVLLLSILIVSWVKQVKLSEYWQQTYQETFVWEQLLQLPHWQTGQQIEPYIHADYAFDWLTQTNQQGNQQLNQTFYADVLLQRQQHAEKHAKQYAQMLEAQQRAKEPPIITQINLLPNKKVFFAGDSLMQGVAPWVMRELQSQYQIGSIDLSKQSTGLSYSSFFDWPATIEKTLQNNPDIGVLVIFLGANDPWAVPDPDKRGGKYIEFATPRWQELYSQKINRILTSAKENNVQVLWVTPPTMKRVKLNEQMKVLTDIYHQTIPKTQALVIDSNDVLIASPASYNYSDSVTVEDKIIKVRSADGIHFTTDGQKLIAKNILSYMQIPNLDTNM